MPSPGLFVAQVGNEALQDILLGGCVPNLRGGPFVVSLAVCCFCVQLSSTVEVEGRKGCPFIWTCNGTTQTSETHSL